MPKGKDMEGEHYKIDMRFLRSLLGLLGIAGMIAAPLAYFAPRPVEIAPDKDAPMTSLRSRTEQLEIWRAAHEAKVAVLKDARDAQIQELEKHMDGQFSNVLTEIRGIRRDAMLRGAKIDPTVREVHFRKLPWVF